jgi:hypothetical protein
MVNAAELFAEGGDGGLIVRSTVSVLIAGSPA